MTREVTFYDAMTSDYKIYLKSKRGRSLASMRGEGKRAGVTRQ